MSKKGFLFTFFVILLLALFTIQFQIRNRANTVLDQTQLYLNRVTETNSFLEDVLQDFNRVIGIVGRQALEGAAQWAIRNDSYVPEMDTAFPELMLLGTLNGSQLNETKDSTLLYWRQAILGLSGKFGVNMTMSNMSVQIREVDEWTLNLTADINITLVDQYSSIRWNFTHTGFFLLDIRDANLTDPVYAIQSRRNYYANFGSYPSEVFQNIIKDTIHGPPFWWNNTPLPFPNNINVTNLSLHMQQQRYLRETGAPSYLMRLEGNFSSSQNGIASFVNITRGITVYNWGVNNGSTRPCTTDYQFLVKGCALKQHKIYNMPDEFIVDVSHLFIYSLQGINRT